jgi:hypothetical protein
MKNKHQHTESTKRKISETRKTRKIIPWNKGKPCSKETKERISCANKGKLKGRKLAQYHKDALLNSHIGKKLSNEHKQKISVGNKGKHHHQHTDATKLKISMALRGKKKPPWTDERKQKLSKLYKGCKLTEEHKKKISVAIRGNKHPLYGKHHSNEAKRKISESNKGCIAWNKGRHWSEEHKIKLSGKNNPMYGRNAEKSPTWKGGISFKPYCYKFNKELKEKIRNRDSYTCQLCGIKENGKKLLIHHIHYDKPNCKPDLITLCRKCNSIVNFNREIFEKHFVDNLKSRGFL